ncbi:olfactory receptor 10G7-like [Alosa sapidissima]|uniref:olfactory receptor 10G7-like n=1 Tax=Alosa sapidissima TaxID=34773 RepID=UPI001C082F46|nr:olfactory receptor 10G7-like [Alosa sapidissima]
MGTTNDSIVRVSELTITGFDHLPHQKLLGSIIMITYVFILIFCTTNISFIISDRQLHSPMYIFICNLAFVDIMFTTAASITMISVLLLEMKTMSYYSCASTMYIYHLGDITGCLAITLMAVDRMLAIKWPLRYHNILTNRRSIILIVVTWLIAIAAMGAVTGVADGLPYCQPIVRYVFCDYPAMVRASCVEPEPYFIVAVILGSWLLGGHFTLIFLTYVVIVVTVLRLSDKGSRKKMSSTCISHVIVCTSYYAPKLVIVLLTRIGVHLNLTERNAVVIIASMLPPLINPVTYCVTTKELRTRLIKLLTQNRIAVK